MRASAQTIGFTAMARDYTTAAWRHPDEIPIVVRGRRGHAARSDTSCRASFIRRRIRFHQAGDAHRQAHEDGVDQPARVDLPRRHEPGRQGRQLGHRSRQSERSHPPRSSARGLHPGRHRRREGVPGEERHADRQRHDGHVRKRQELLSRVAGHWSSGGERQMINRRLPALRAALVASVALVFAAPAFAQEATLSGTISDATSSVLPGVTITAVHAASGNTFVAVTDDRGFYRLPLRTGVYRLSAELAGFANVNRSVELLVGQQAVMNLQMAPSAVQESVTVTAEAPLLDMTSSTLAGNVDPRQMQDLPVNGRNWLDLTMLTPGARTNSVGEAPVLGDGRGTYQLNVDGQQVTNYVQFNRANPRYSRDAIAEFEFVANRFDATQGRSMGVQVNAITKSGTNTPGGTLSGYFRDDAFNAPDFVAHKRLPYSNQQISGTFGGPLKRDRVHYFANYGYEREPRTSTWTTPYRAFNIDLTGTRWQRETGLRVDVQFSPRTRLAMRGTNWREFIPYAAGSATSTPAATVETDNTSNQIKGGYAGSGWDQTSPVKNPKATVTAGFGSPNIMLRGLTIGTGTFVPQRPRQKG